jgi:hypothetical protein
MLKTFSMFAMAGLMTLAVTGGSQAQERVFRKMTSGEPAALQNSMTEAQARRQCRMEMSGSRESKKSIATKMRGCIDRKTQGAGRN